MLFIHQQFQSFLHLGVCKEYPIMARTKSTKKNEVVIKDQPTTTSANPLPKAQESAPVAVPATVPTAIAAATEPRRLEIVKPDPRANIVPINLEDEIRKLAYEFSARRGFIPGYENEDWLAAEREIRQRYHQRSA
jgi:Protein of unknown function (DUF2934)